MGTCGGRGTVTRICAALVALVVSASFATPLAAQSADLLTGRVVDPTGAAVADANVRIEIGGNTVAETQTDASGRFGVAVMNDTTRTVVVVVPGFALSRTSAAAGVREVDVTLEPAPLFEAVNVTSSRGELVRVDPTSTVTVLSSNELLTSAPMTIAVNAGSFRVAMLITTVNVITVRGSAARIQPIAASLLMNRVM